MLVFHAVVPIETGEIERATNRAGDMAAVSRTEDGVVDYRVAVDVEDPTLLRFFERYADEASFEAHLEADHYREFMALLPDMVAGEPDITRFEVDAATDVEL